MRSNHPGVSRFTWEGKIAAVLLLSLFFCIGSVAQPTSDSSRSSFGDGSEPRITLTGWADRHRLLVLDRRQNRGNRLYDRGRFRHVVPRKDREYALDMLAQRFTWEEFGIPARADNSLLLRVGSVRRDLFAFVSHLRSTVPLDSAHSLDITATLQQDAVAVRGFLELGYEWQVSQHHAMGVRHTFSEYKPDLDATPYYRYTHPRVGEAEAALTVQNLYSDLIDQHLSIPPRHRDVIRSYARQPVLVSVSYTSPAQWALQGEVVGAVQPTSRAIYASQSNPAYRYRDDERLHYLGALLAYEFAPSVYGGLFYKRDASWLRREGRGDEVESDYTSRQQFWRAGGFLRKDWGRVRTTVRVFTGAYRDRQDGRNLAESILPREIEYDEVQQGIRARAEYRLESGPFTALGYDGLRRDYRGPEEVEPSEAFAPWVNWGAPGDPGLNNHRLVGYVGYRFSRGKLLFGFGADLDGDDQHPNKPSPKRFDNGFGRLILTW